MPTTFLYFSLKQKNVELITSKQVTKKAKINNCKIK